MTHLDHLRVRNLVGTQVQERDFIICMLGTSLIRVLALIFILVTSSVAAVRTARPMQTPAQSKSHLAVKGELKDEHGDVIVAAKVTLTPNGGTLMETTTDEKGRFSFDIASPGSYTIQVSVGGFGLYTQTISVDADKPPANLQITLHPVVAESLKVDASENTVGLDPQNAGGAQVLKQKDLDALPDDPDQLMQQLQDLATSSGSAPGQAIVTVDGFINDGRLPPKSSIGEVRINPDLYSAEYYTPPYQGGRIEIITKPGAEQFHGQGFFIFNDSAFNAREVFAPTKLPADTKQYGFQLGGPIVPKRAGFLIDVQARDINQLAVVDALTLGAGLQPAPFS
ncbi:MAG TPA: carboxypeptidase-like regulatory domain-containing protein, partial [Blastocatellia bacterium]